MKVYFFIIITTFLLLKTSARDIFEQFEEKTKTNKQLKKKNRGEKPVFTSKAFMNVRNGNVQERTVKITTKKVRMINGVIVENEETSTTKRNGVEVNVSFGSNKSKRPSPNESVRPSIYRSGRPSQFEIEKQKIDDLIKRRKKESQQKLEDLIKRRQEAEKREDLEKKNLDIERKRKLEEIILKRERRKERLNDQDEKIRKFNELEHNNRNNDRSQKFTRPSINDKARNDKILLKKKQDELAKRERDKIIKARRDLIKKKEEEEAEKERERLRIIKEKRDLIKKKEEEAEKERERLRIIKEKKARQNEIDARMAKIKEDKKKKEEDAYRAKIFRDLEDKKKKEEDAYRAKIFRDLEDSSKKDLGKGNLVKNRAKFFENNDKIDVGKNKGIYPPKKKLVDNNSSIKIGKLEKNSAIIKNKVVQPKPEKVFAQINAGKNENSGNLDTNPDFRTIEIVYDLQFLKIELKKLGKLNLYGDFKQLIMRCDMIFKRYLKVHKDVNQRILVERNFGSCQASNNSDFNFEPKNFPKQQIYNGDLVIFVAAYSDENSSTIASAVPCRKSSDGNNRSIVGRILFNIPKMVLDQNDSFNFKNSMQTTIHELFHVLAFSKRLQTNFNEKRDLILNQPHLYKLAKHFNNKKKQFDPINQEEEIEKIKPLKDEAHWSNNYIPNDLMIPISRNNLILSIFSLEYVDLATTDLTTDLTKVENNYMMKDLNNAFWDYDCHAESAEGKNSRYPWLCTAWQRENDYTGCSADYNAKAACSLTYDENSGCGERFISSSGNCRDTRSPPGKNRKPYEVYSDRSRCFQMLPQYGGACLQFEIKNKNEIHINIQGKNFVCKSGETVYFEYKNKVDGKLQNCEDKIRCPDFNEFNKQYEKTKCPYNCHFNGVCVDGKCDCYAGWDPNNDCSSRMSVGNGTYSTRFVEV